MLFDQLFYNFRDIREDIFWVFNLCNEYLFYGWWHLQKIEDLPLQKNNNFIKKSIHISIHQWYLLNMFNITLAMVQSQNRKLSVVGQICFFLFLRYSKNCYRSRKLSNSPFQPHKLLQYYLINLMTSYSFKI